ncbi:hypothetical protein HPB51_008932 [Rhipicephalus microplus]|uniref:Uncharacterized protein n=1 Tax=Rhipicephalus microplus TaxID=6941 RepID=A0A9J6D4P7_RHIMP|nr:hypothetical protein HPB51_008932 [Rhipicephalus microplus]
MGRCGKHAQLLRNGNTVDAVRRSATDPFCERMADWWAPSAIKLQVSAEGRMEFLYVRYIAESSSLVAEVAAAVGCRVVSEPVQNEPVQTSCVALATDDGRLTHS